MPARPDATNPDRQPANGAMPTRAELRAMGQLAMPVIVVQVGIMLMGVVDTIMVGRVSAEALASVAIGNLYFFVLSMFGLGTLLALDPIVSQAVGADDERGIARALQRGLVLSVFLSLLVGTALLSAEPALHLARQPVEIIPDAAAYARICIPGLPAFFAFGVFRQSLQAMRRMRPIVITIIAANLVNVFFNWVLIFGHLGSPALGAIGSAWASTVSRWLAVAAIIVTAWPILRPYLRPLRGDSVAIRPLGRMLRLGTPVGLQQLLESAAFGAIGLLMGTFGTIQVAAHQVAINLASLTFMVPLAVGAAAAVMVGHAIGAGDALAARRAAGAALLWGAGFMCLSAMIFLVAPRALARLYTTDPQVLALAALLIPIAGVFQVADGLQAVSAGVLRGAGDTRTPLIVILLGFWLVGTPVSLFLAFRTPAGPAGLWWGLVAGLGSVAVLLLVRVRSKLRRPLSRVMMDDEQHVPAL